MDKTIKIDVFEWCKKYRRLIIAVISIFLLSFLLTAVSAIIIYGGVGIFFINYLYLIGLAIIVFFIMLALFSYLFYQNVPEAKTTKNLIVIFSVMFISVLMSVVSMEYINIYAVPIAMSAVTVAILVYRQLGFVSSCFGAIITMGIFSTIEWIINGSFNFNVVIAVLIGLMQSYCMMNLIRKSYTRFKLLWGALAMGLIFAPIAIISSAIFSDNLTEILLAGVYCFCGNALAVGVFTAIIPLYESIFNVWTDFKLAESCSVARPLLQRLSTEAAGTFNHCIIVSNLCESCALAIGENPYLAKACGIYHDVGKLKNPEFFVENQADGYNPHDDLIPEASVSMIINHTLSGYELLKENRMPEEIAKVAKEHHGTSPVMYFYNKAKKLTEGELDRGAFEYYGPKPSSKISAIVMISDMVEAATRARTPETTEELDKLINELVMQKIEENQFSDCSITFKDLTKIKQTILKVIPSIYHKRIKYKD